jgi:mannosyltransferase OCH1-like enzyme
MILIPKILHYVWLGTKPMHPLMIEWREKWQRLHPDWIIKVWRQIEGCKEHFLRCEDGQVIECRVPEYLARCPTFAKRSDVWRYEILEQLGGIYLDTDFEPVKNLEPLLDETTAFAGLCKTLYGWYDHCPEGKTKIEVGCSIMGCVPHHPWLRELVRRTPGQDPKAQLALAFPFLTEVTGRHPDVKLFESTVFYPVTWDKYALGGRRALHKEIIPETTYAVHRWSSSWFANGLTPIEDARP